MSAPNYPYRYHLACGAAMGGGGLLLVCALWSAASLLASLPPPNAGAPASANAEDAAAGNAATEDAAAPPRHGAFYLLAAGQRGLVGLGLLVAGALCWRGVNEGRLFALLAGWLGVLLVAVEAYVAALLPPRPWAWWEALGIVLALGAELLYFVLLLGYFTRNDVRAWLEPVPAWFHDRRPLPEPARDAPRADGATSPADTPA